MAGLDVADFPAFFRELHDGHDPFPWQENLVAWIVARRRWPDALDVPTGLGKTAVLDVAVFLAALDPGLVPRRVFFVVDRRLVVDEAYEHARHIAGRLAAASGGVCAEVAARLRVPGDDGPVLDVTRMRGGTTWSSQWLERPDRHAVVVGTVDQVGSRLLFRGYGVSEFRRPIDAALVGTDSLIVLDEAHLSGAFFRTLREATALDGSPLVRPPCVVTMSATLAETDDQPSAAIPWEVFAIGSADREHHRARLRLRAAKRLHTVEVSTTPATAAAAMPVALADWALALASPDAGLSVGGAPHPAAVVGVVANTVARARAAFEHLREGQRAILLTGRVRPVDRDYLLARWYPLIRAGRTRTAGPPLFVVATQTIEVGANIDLDALVTESAPLPALVQRLGRLNRLGAIDQPGPGGRSPLAVVLHEASATGDDPVYGPARLRTWKWLTIHQPAVPHKAGHAVALPPPDSGLDVCPDALRGLVHRLAPTVRRPMEDARPEAPVLTHVTVDAWARTSPQPHPDTPVAPFLHGLETHTAVVQVVWRHGLALELTDADCEQVEEIPPAPGEAVELPLAAVRRWLRGHQRQDTAVSDLGVDHDPAEDDGPKPGGWTPEPPQRVIRYVGREGSEIVFPGRIQPGDLIVVPADYGGCDEYGWHPASTVPVVDVADVAGRRRGNALLRVGPTLDAVAAAPYEPWRAGEPPVAGLRDLLAALHRLARGETAEDPEDETGYVRVLREFAALASPVPTEWPLLRTLGTLAAAGHLRVVHREPADEDEGTDDAARTPYEVLLVATVSRFAEDETSAGTSMLRGKLTLRQHQAAVRARAEEIAGTLGLPAEIVAAVGLAAWWHDEGKRDDRFQAMLRGGVRQLAEVHADEPLAKSGMDPADRAAFERARAHSGYPDGMRHEALSARIAAAYLGAADGDAAVDTDLVVHLVASHHGRGRPLLPPVADPAPVTVSVPVGGETLVLSSKHTVDWDGPRRFAELNARYGRWGLALLETIVRLADIWCSIRSEER